MQFDHAVILYDQFFYSIDVYIPLNCRNLKRSDETFLNLWGIFLNRTAEGICNATKKNEKPKMIFWSSKLTDSERRSEFLDPKHSIIQIWAGGDDKNIVPVLRNGYEIIMSNNDALYLDCG